MFSLSSGSNTFRLMYSSSIAGTLATNTLDIAGGVSQSAYFRVEPVNSQQQAILANSVSTDTTNGERIGRARIASGCASVTSQSNDWISSVSSPGTGQCTINFTTGKFSSAPICVCSTVGQRTCRLNAASTTSALTVDMYDGSNPPVLVNTALDIICMGPR